MHVHPVLFQMALDLGIQFGAGAMRVPADDLAAFERHYGKASPGARAQWTVFRILTRRMKQKLAEKGFAFCTRVYGHLGSGRMEESYVLGLLDRLPPGAHEIYVHPALLDAGDRPTPDRLQGQTELDILLSPRVKERIRSLDILAATYKDLEVTA